MGSKARQSRHAVRLLKVECRSEDHVLDNLWAEALQGEDATVPYRKKRRHPKVVDCPARGEAECECCTRACREAGRRAKKSGKIEQKDYAPEEPLSKRDYGNPG